MNRAGWVFQPEAIDDHHDSMHASSSSSITVHTAGLDDPKWCDWQSDQGWKTRGLHRGQRTNMRCLSPVARTSPACAVVGSPERIPRGARPTWPGGSFHRRHKSLGTEVFDFFQPERTVREIEKAECAPRERMGLLRRRMQAHQHLRRRTSSRAAAARSGGWYPLLIGLRDSWSQWTQSARGF